MIRKETILISSTQYPYYGGSATNAYALTKEFRKLGYRTAGLFIDNNISKIDPDNIGGIFGAQNNSDIKNVKKQIDTYLSSEPDFIFAKNYVAPVFCRNIYPKSKITYLVAGCPHMMQLSKNGISAISYLKSNDMILFEQEKRCINISDYVIPNSNIGKKLLIKHYGNLSKILNPINTSYIINNIPKNIPFDVRKIDVAFIASNFKRDVKNAKFAKEIFQKIPNLNKYVIGENSNYFNDISNVQILSSVDNKKIINILSNTKIVICTSFYDASPNIVMEAISCGSNVLISQNCGWTDILGSQSICSDVYNSNEWIIKIKNLLLKKIDYNLKINFSIPEKLIEEIR